jgi:23S rRNA pseudouridine1911/1915/1917 synthase
VNIRFEVTREDNGLRLDQVVPKHVPALSRRKARTVIDLGGVFVDKHRVKIAGKLVHAGQVVEVNVGGVLDRATGGGNADGRPADADDPALAPRIVHLDDHVVVVDKPAGLVTAPTPESDRGDLFDRIARQLGIDGKRAELYLVHRLDRPTSGLLVFARTREANKRLGDAFVRHDVDREYRAVAVGTVGAQTIDRPIGERRAVTHISVDEALAGATLVTARLETGRSHQIRIHLAGVGHPLAGDHQHGGEVSRTFSPRAPRLALHAGLLGFTHPATGARVRFEAPIPDELGDWIAKLRTPPTTA